VRNYYHFDNATFTVSSTQHKEHGRPGNSEKRSVSNCRRSCRRGALYPRLLSGRLYGLPLRRFVGWDSALLDGGGNIHLFTSIKPASVEVGQRK